MTRCPYCGFNKIYKLARQGRFCCASRTCRKQFSHKTQSAMRYGKKPLDWYEQIISMHRGGMNVHQISRTGIGKHLSSKQREELFLRLDGQCHICHRTIERNERWEVSHPIPIELGGPDDDSNRAPAHFKCHKWQTRMVDIPAIAKSKRIVRREYDIARPRRPLPGGRSDIFKKRMDGTVVLRSTGQSPSWRGSQ